MDGDETEELEDETSFESSDPSGLKNDDSGGWVHAAPSTRRKSSRKSCRHHRNAETATTSSSNASKELNERPKVKSKSISSSLRLRFIARRSSAIENRSIANGLKLAQTQAIAVAGFLADVDARQWKGCDSPITHRASYHGRGELSCRNWPFSSILNIYYYCYVD